MVTRVDEKHFAWLSLLASSGTLICCALPIALVTLGLGATVAAVSGSFPFLIALSVHKGWVFAASGVLLVVAGWLAFRPGRSCPTDPELAALCKRAEVWNRRVFWASASIWGVGFFAAFLALPVRIWLDS